jgi:CheY-like chemotaxis protein
MKKVLVVEDNSDNLRLISYALHRSGYEIISADTGIKGVELAIAERPALIIMDKIHALLGWSESHSTKNEVHQ